jgi:hypothetical protein
MDVTARSMQKEALEPSMEYTCMEICHGAIVSLAAFSMAEAETSAWEDWLAALITSRWASATSAKHSLWANVLARALRFLANEVVGLEDFAAELPGRDAAAGILTMTGFVCRLSQSWSMDSGTDAKGPVLLRYSLDHLMQVRAHPLRCPPRSAVALDERFITRLQHLLSNVYQWSVVLASLAEVLCW